MAPGERASEEAPGAGAAPRLTRTEKLVRGGYRTALWTLAGLAASVAALWTLHRDAENWVVHTRVVLRVARESLALTIERSTSIRAFLLTADSTTLEAEHRARVLLPATLDSMVALTADDPQQHARALAVRQALALWEREFALPALSEPPAVAVHRPYVVRTLAGKTLLDPVRVQFARFIDIEDRLFAERLRRTRTLGWLLLIAVLGELAVLAVLLRRFRHRVVDLTSELERNVARLAAANAELQAFSHSVAHDLRSPLRAIDGFSHALLEDHGEQLGESGRGQLARIRANAQRLGELIDGLLGLARLSSRELRRERVHLGALAREVVAELGAAQPARTVQLRIADGLTAVGDSRLLRLLMQNLLGNAWKFTARRDDAVLEIGAERQDGGQVYFVRDNGVGFDMTFADKLFGAFERLHPGREFAGHGLGLAIARRIVERHGGRIWAVGRVGEGATMYFTLPGTQRDSG